MKLHIPQFIRKPVLLSFVLSACASTGKGVLLGTVIGGAAGGVVGGSTSAGGNRTKATLTGVGIGAATGALFGYIASKNEQELERRKHARSASPSSDRKLFLTKPEVRSIWVEDKIEGNRFVEGHYIHIIENPSGWGRE